MTIFLAVHIYGLVRTYPSDHEVHIRLILKLFILIPKQRMGHLTTMTLVKKLSAALFLVSTAHAQFGPVTSASSTSIDPAPIASIGCRIVDGAWECSAPRTAAASSTSVSLAPSSAIAEASQSPSETTPTGTSDVPAPPAESTGCELHGDHYHCEGPAAGFEDQTVTNTAEPSIPSPTESSNCVWRAYIRSECRA